MQEIKDEANRKNQEIDIALEVKFSHYMCGASTKLYNYMFQLTPLSDGLLTFWDSTCHHNLANYWKWSTNLNEQVTKYIITGSLAKKDGVPTLDDLFSQMGRFPYVQVPAPYNSSAPGIRERQNNRYNEHAQYNTNYGRAVYRRLGEENSGTSGYLSFLFILIGLLATYHVARVFYRAYKSNLANPRCAAEDLSDARDSVASHVQAIEIIEHAC